jgi:DMSO/TMAO reductase YedYZ molybdopterin-dependent catalytic subunit
MSDFGRARTRRSFLLLALFVMALCGVWHWLHNEPLIDQAPRPLRQVLELNGKIWRQIFSPKRLSVCVPPPAGRKPRVNGVLGLDGPVDVQSWRLEVLDDDQHLQLTLHDLQVLPRSEINSPLRCIEGWSEDMSFGGVRFSDFMQAYHLRPHRYVGLETTDGEYYVSIDMESMLHPQTLLAMEMNGETLLPTNGAPLRLAIPVKYGIKNIKRIGKIFFSDERPPDYWAEQGYDWFAGL